jgi:hypothetical protein
MKYPEYPQLECVDADLLEACEKAWGPNPDGWDVAACINSQLIREMRKLSGALAVKADSFANHKSPGRGGAYATFPGAVYMSDLGCGHLK